MNEVKRLSLDMQYPFQYMEDENGNLVYYKDYAALQQQLTNILKSAGIEADTVQAGVMQLKTRLEALAVENDLIHSNPSLASMMDALDKFYEHEHLPETGMLAAYKTLLPKRSPATEAYLNAVRAEVLENVPTVCDGKEQLAFEAYASSKGLDLSKHPLHYLFLDGKTNQARSAWRECLVYVAAQLRAGNDDKSALMMKAGKLVKASEEDSRQVSEFMRAAETPGDQLRAGNAGKDGV